MSNTIKNQLYDIIENLNEEEQLNILMYVKSLINHHRKGNSGKELLRFQGKISRDDLQMINSLIEKDCRKVDLNEW